VQQITPFLWFDGNAEEAVNFYVTVFKDAKIISTARYGEAGPGPAGSVMTMKFQLGGIEFVALNGGPHYTFSPAVSFVVNCETQPVGVEKVITNLLIFIRSVWQRRVFGSIV
jgi:predicted 3-demethylubiquinone-9 3-methyltransferase (glyoxalase superfamily)